MYKILKQFGNPKFCKVGNLIKPDKFAKHEMEFLEANGFIEKEKGAIISDEKK